MTDSIEQIGADWVNVTRCIKCRHHSPQMGRTVFCDFWESYVAPEFWCAEGKDGGKHETD